MSSKLPPKRDDPEQSKRFIETARKIGAGETEESAERALKKVDLHKKPAPKRGR